MIRVHILSDGFSTPNARAFAFPFVRHRQALRREGFCLTSFKTEHVRLTECDILIVDSKYFHGPSRGEPEYVYRRLEAWRERLDATLWFDTTDSAGWVFEGALKVAKAYYKGQLLRDRSLYLQPMYGRRVYADFYHRHDGVTDAQPSQASQITDAKLLGRLHISWNSGLADYSYLGPLRMALYGRLRYSALLRWPNQLQQPLSARPNPVSCRFGTTYKQASVAHQRLAISRKLGARLSTNKLSRRRYLNELRQSKIIISPFGLGEITLKDFEVFLSGGILFKPDMSHLETWPDLFQNEKTMIPFLWDLSDLEERIGDVLQQYERYLPVAEAGQEMYRLALNDGPGRDAFLRRFTTIAERALQ